MRNLKINTSIPKTPSWRMTRWRLRKKTPNRSFTIPPLTFQDLSAASPRIWGNDTPIWAPGRSAQGPWARGQVPGPGQGPSPGPAHSTHRSTPPLGIGLFVTLSAPNSSRGPPHRELSIPPSPSGAPSVFCSQAQNPETNPRVLVELHIRQRCQDRDVVVDANDFADEDLYGPAHGPVISSNVLEGPVDRDRKRVQTTPALSTHPLTLPIRPTLAS